MKIRWELTNEDISRIQSFMNISKNHIFVKRRTKRNVDIKYIPEIDKETVWYVLVTCLLSTQQCSGPGSRLYRFCSTDPFPLNYKLCVYNKKELGSFISDKLKGFGGIRRYRTIGNQSKKNFVWIRERWSDLHRIVEE